MFRNRTTPAFVSALFAVFFILAPALAQQGQGQKQMSEEEMKEMMEKLQRQQRRPQMTQVESGTYTNEEDGYSIDVPDGWTGMEMRGMLIAAKGDMKQMRPRPDAESFTVFVEKKEDVEAKFGGQSFEEIDLDAFRAEVKESMKQRGQAAEIEIKSLEHEQVAGKQAMHVVERMKVPTGPQQKSWVQSELYVFDNGADLVHIMYSAPEEAWGEYGEFVAEHVGSLSLD